MVFWGGLRRELTCENGVAMLRPPRGAAGAPRGAKKMAVSVAVSADLVLEQQ